MIVYSPSYNVALSSPDLAAHATWWLTSALWHCSGRRACFLYHQHTRLQSFEFKTFFTRERRSSLIRFAKFGWHCHWPHQLLLLLYLILPGCNIASLVVQCLVEKYVKWYRLFVLQNLRWFRHFWGCGHVSLAPSCPQSENVVITDISKMRTMHLTLCCLADFRDVSA